MVRIHTNRLLSSISWSVKRALESSSTWWQTLSYNNYLDLDAALRLVRSISQTCDFGSHSCVVIKHTNPCGASISENQVSAWENSLASDPESAFGCVIAFDRGGRERNRGVDWQSLLFECMIAPGYESDALEILSESKNRRILTLDPLGEITDEPRFDKYREAGYPRYRAFLTSIGKM